MKKALALICALVGTVSVALAQSTSPPQAPALNADQIYFKAVEVLRNLPEPPYIAYTLTMDGEVLRHTGSTVDRVVLRSSDGMLFAHPVSSDGKPVDSAKVPDSIADTDLSPDFMMVMQRNAGKKAQSSIFGLSLGAMATPGPQDAADGLKTVGSVRVIYNSHYDVTLEGVQPFPGCSPSVYHLALRARRDPMDNPVRAMWIDTQTFNLCMVSLGAMLDEGPFHAPVSADVTFSRHGRYWLADQINVGGRSRFMFISASMAFRVGYSDVSFPATEPAWMFDPKLYAQHSGREAGKGIAISVH